ncbi:GMC family oxidoreductase N-terminal domain-containing protein [Mesorhizobium sp.]|uniref:GMC family oxidoreductase n=1 Tax=Mesorhizobium sp. TaxID=1871066 RepID=UPI000FE5F7D3|nr:GMC family oxidoreductase N-terminal domain-containing protein [Mesorhizobium sp.]RWJ05733.1 MAG: choline dehydrogenase [Mesorhizobium sp.]
MPDKIEDYGEYDYIVVGAGSAGSVVATRLAEDPKTRVLVLEAGAHYRNPLYSMPLLAGRLFEMKQHNWFYQTVPQKHLDNRVLFLPRGKMVGGSFIFNGTQFVRGNRYDYDLWAQLGARGWSYSDVLPYFKRVESFDGDASLYHSKDGKLTVARAPAVNPISLACLDAAVEAGFSRNDDFNGAVQDGFGRFHFNIKRGKRQTTALAYLYPALKNGNIDLATHALSRRIVFENGKAIGVKFYRGSQLRLARARREIILCAGAINSPQLLLISGIGDVAQLRRHGIPLVTEAPEVGRNMQDHVYVYMGYECLRAKSLMQDLRADKVVLGILNAFFRGKGAVSQSPLEVGGFFRSKPGLAAPDMQSNFVPIMNLSARIWAPWERRVIQDTFAGYVWQNRPASRGTVSLASADVRDAPLIDPNYFDAESDLQTTREGVREIRRIVSHPALDDYRGNELAPSAGMNSDDEIDAFIRANAGTSHHSASTLRMGSDPTSVVDPELRVRGVTGLRVADASVMPTVVSGNTNAATIMIAEKAADLIRGRCLPPLEVPPYPKDA